MGKVLWSEIYKSMEYDRLEYGEKKRVLLNQILKVVLFRFRTDRGMLNEGGICSSMGEVLWE